jgi:hypothetical protein
MAYILDLDIGELSTREDFERQDRKWREYYDYLKSVRERMPRSAYEFATASWRYVPTDTRCLHDSWVDSLVIREPARGDRHQIRSLEIELRLFGWNHDGNTTLIYHEVYSYSLDTPFKLVSLPRDAGHGDWLCDEVRLSQQDHVLHEVEFSRGSRWLIECRDIEWSWKPFTVSA